MFLELLWDGAKIELECYWKHPRDTYEMAEHLKVAARPVLLEIQSGEHSSHKVQVLTCNPVFEAAEMDLVRRFRDRLKS